MPRLHSSFLIRCWQTSSGLQRLEILHIQSGEKVLVTSFESAVDWLKTVGAEVSAHADEKSLGREGVPE